ncbi:MAG: lamin tail domain-containing protein [Desulfuromonadaceae bacterium]
MKKLVAATAIIAALAGAGSADAALYISQIYGGGGATAAAPLYSNDWVQLYNSGATGINLSGYSLQYASATNLTTFGLTHALTGTIASNSYFLIQESRGTGLTGTAADPIYNQTGGALALSATTGKIALFSTTAIGASTVATSANLVDLVGFGTTANFSLYPKMTSNLSTTTSALRTTDALGAVTFVAGTPTPNPVAATPIPAAAWLLGSGLLGLFGIRRRNI